MNEGGGLGTACGMDSMPIHVGDSRVQCGTDGSVNCETRRGPRVPGVGLWDGCRGINALWGMWLPKGRSDDEWMQRCPGQRTLSLSSLS